MQATRQLSVRVSDDLRREVKRQAAAEGTSVQAFVERVLRQALASPGPPPALSEQTRHAILEFVRNDYPKLTRQIGEEDPDLATM